MLKNRAEGEQDDRRLPAALASDDPGRWEAAFRELCRRFHKRLLGFFSRRGFGPETSEDLTQHTFLRVYRSRKSFRGETPLASWIFQIAANVYRNEIRRRRAGMRDAPEVPLPEPGGADDSVGAPAAEPAAPNPGQLERMLGREMIEAMRQAVARLPPQMRRALTLQHRHGYSVAEIATLMKIREATVKVHLHHARKRLRRALEERFGELPF